jgi:putative effector of murein hydrolase
MITDKIITIWMLSTALCFLFLTKKSKDFGSFAAQYMSWLLSPAVLLFSIILTYFQKKRLRWFEKHWFAISLSQTLSYLTNYKRRAYK